MSWACELTEDARKDLKALPRKIQERIARVFHQMTAAGPFQGDVKALQGEEWRGVFRRRIGSYRILFALDQNKHLVTVLRILIRSKETYS